METKSEFDIDQYYNVIGVKYLIYHEETSLFYLVCNEMFGELGFYLISFSENKPKKFKIITALVTKLEISNVTMYFSKGIDKKGSVFKELIIGYKTMNINTYNTIIQDL